MKDVFKGKNILVTGGAGSIGNVLVAALLKENPNKIRVLDIDETRLFEMDQKLTGGKEHPVLRFLVGDIKDYDRLEKACEDIHVIFHLAALKHVVSCEYNAEEAMKVNVLGATNVIKASLAHNVERVVFTSSDKAAEPFSTMGATKLLAERLFNAANWTRGKKKTIFGSVRFGNVMGTRGGVIPLWKRQIYTSKEITVTDPEMSRFMMTMGQAVKLILKCATDMQKDGGTFILKMPVINVGDLAKVVTAYYNRPDIKMKITGMKPGETKFELLMSDKEREIAEEREEYYFIKPFIKLFQQGAFSKIDGPVSRVGWDSRMTKIMDRGDLKKLLLKEGLL